MDTDGYDISEVRGHLRFSSRSFYPQLVRWPCASARALLASSSLRRPPFISIRFFCRSCSLIISFCSSPGHVSFSLFLRLLPLGGSPAFRVHFILPSSLSVRPSRGRLFHPARRDGSVRAFISCRPSCRPFFLRPEDRARLLFHVPRVVLPSFSKFLFIII